MKFLVFISFVVVFCSSSAFSQKKLTLKAFLDHKCFYHPEVGNFVEIHLQMVGYSLNYQPVEGGLQNEIAVQYVFKQGDQEVISDAYRLQSPIMRDSIIEDFYEIKRIPLKPGNYTLELTLTDLHSKTGNPITAIQNIEVEDLAQKVNLSNIETAEMMHKTKSENVFSKSGYDIIPRISNYYSTLANALPVYMEVYRPTEANDTTTQVFGLKQMVRDAKSKTELEPYTRFSKVEVGQVQPLIRVIDISKLPSGNYELYYELVDRENKILASSSYFFERFNEEEYEQVVAENIILDPQFQSSIADDSLAFYIASLIPISKPAEARNIMDLLKTKDKELYRKYMQSYWTTTAAGGSAYDSWLKYKVQVLLVQRLYASNFMDGYETDRGRVYLQYGPPSNIIIRENSPNEYPYEIWRYDKIKVYSNKRFIFYNPDLVNNGYRLLHSELIGEVQNYRWQQQLSKRNSVNGNIDDPNDGNFNHYGGNSNSLFNQY